MNKRARTAFLDVLMIVILILIIVLKTEDNTSKSEEEVPPGSVVVQAEWQEGIDVDIDLWVRAPGDTPVGYSNKGSKYFNLLRDDLGATGDVTPLNMEYSYSRGQPPGEYAVNLHYFTKRGKVPEVIVVQVRISVVQNRKTVIIFERTVELMLAGQEITVQRFTLDEDGRVVGESIIPVPLRTGSPGVMGGIGAR